MPEDQPKGVNSERTTAPRKQDIIKINIGDKTEELPVVAVNHLFADIDRHNQQFSMASMMARSIFRHVRFEDETNKEPVPASLSGEEDHQQMNASALVVIHKETLNKIGLSLEPVSGKGAVLMYEGEEAGEGEMRINVSNRNRFIPFLEALAPDQVEETGLKPNLESLSKVLSQQVLDHYDLKEPNDEALQLLGGLGKIIDEYKRLGMSKAVTRLETYLNHARQGDLREFVAVENAGLLSEPGKYFGPADWQGDSTPAGLRQRWDEALRVVKTAKANPKAGSLYKQLSEHLIKCIKIARNDPSPANYSPELGA